MFKNFKVTAYMSAPIATTGIILLDGILSAAIAKDLLKDEYYAGENICGTKEQIDEMLSPILDRKQGVYCASAGFGDNKEFITSWCKRWDNNHDDMVTGFKGKVRIDDGAGYFKSYHMPLVVKSYKTITFYVRGDMSKIKELLENYIFYLGKKATQGFGQIRKWEFEEIEENWSLWKDNKPMRPIPGRECLNWLKSNRECNIQEHALIPPYWRQDYRELCVFPEV